MIKFNRTTGSKSVKATIGELFMSQSISTLKDKMKNQIKNYLKKSGKRK